MTQVKGRTAAGGKRVRWGKGAIKKFDVTFVSHFDGRVHGVKQVDGRQVTGDVDSFVAWDFDGMHGFADRVDGKWVTQIWDDETFFRRFPHTAGWFFHHFGGDV